MSGTAGYLTTLRISNDGGGSYTALGGFDQADPNIQLALEEVTEFGDEAVDRIATLFDSQVSLSGNERYDDAGQDILRAAFFARTKVRLEILTTAGGNGFQIDLLCTQYQAGSQVGSKVSLSTQFQGAGTKPIIITP